MSGSASAVRQRREVKDFLEDAVPPDAGGADTERATDPADARAVLYESITSGGASGWHGCLLRARGCVVRGCSIRWRRDCRVYVRRP